MEVVSQTPFSGLIGHERIQTVLTATISHPAGAYLFFGPQGVGKKLLAERFSRALLDLPETMTLESHPDFVRLTREPEAREITVKQVRELLNRMHLSSARGGRRLALIEAADHLNEEACNALLKDVEEPGRDVTFLFLADQVDRLPGTLRSRLVPLRCDRVPHQVLVGWLVTQHNCSQEEAETLARASGGAPGRALALRGALSTHATSAQNLLTALYTQNAGQALAVLDGFTKQIEKTDDPEASWRLLLQAMMQQMQTNPAAPVEAIRAGRAIAHVWRLIGSSVPPRLGFEWSTLEQAFVSQHRVAALLVQDAS